MDLDEEMMPYSPSADSSPSSSDLDTESTGSFFPDRSTTLGTLMGVSAFGGQRRSTRAAPGEVFFFHRSSTHRRRPCSSSPRFRNLQSLSGNLAWSNTLQNVNDIQQTFSEAMAYVEECRRPALSRVVLDYLRVNTGPVNDLFIVKNFSCYTKDGIYAALHVVKKMLRSDFIYVVNDTREAQLVIRCSDPIDAQRLDCRNVQFKFDNQIIKIYKLTTISPHPQGDDILYEAPVNSFIAALEGRTEAGYPVGYSGVLEDMQPHRNPIMSVSTMRILGIDEGPVQNVMKCNIINAVYPAEFLYATRVIPCVGHYTFAVDQDGSLYFRFDRASDTELLVWSHFFLDRHMVKFYMVRTVRKLNTVDDKAIGNPVYSRRSAIEHWEPVYA